MIDFTYFSNLECSTPINVIIFFWDNSWELLHTRLVVKAIERKKLVHHKQSRFVFLETSTWPHARTLTQTTLQLFCDEITDCLCRADKTLAEFLSLYCSLPHWRNLLESRQRCDNGSVPSSRENSRCARKLLPCNVRGPSPHCICRDLCSPILMTDRVHFLTWLCNLAGNLHDS